MSFPIRHLLSLQTIRHAGTRSRSKYDTIRLHCMRNAKIGGFFICEPLTLSNLFRSPRSHKSRKRYRGDGTGSRLNGRGSKGQKSRSGPGIPRGFEGGQTELRFRFPKKSAEIKSMERAYEGYGRIHLDQIQRWLDIGRLDGSKPLTLSSFYDAGLTSIRRGLLITDGGCEHFTHIVHIEATEFTPEAIGRIEELGGKAIAVYHSREDIKVLTRPEFYFFTEARKWVLFKKYAGQLSSYLVSRNLPGHSVEALKNRLTEREFHNFVMNANFEAGRVLKRRNMVRFSLFDVFGDLIKGERGIKKTQTRESIRAILKGQPESLASALIRGFLPPFSSPKEYKDILFYTSDEKRGYLSNHVLTSVLSNKHSEFSSQIYPGLKYWIEKNYIVFTRDQEQYDLVVGHFRWENARLKAIKTQQEETAKETAKRDRILAILQEKGLKLDVPRFVGPKDHGELGRRDLERLFSCQ
ncbi:YmL10 [Mitosporidium daphniae]